MIPDYFRLAQFSTLHREGGYQGDAHTSNHIVQKQRSQRGGEYEEVNDDAFDGRIGFVKQEIAS